MEKMLFAVIFVLFCSQSLAQNLEPTSGTSLGEPKVSDKIPEIEKSTEEFELDDDLDDKENPKESKSMFLNFL